jgi:hypothetical protein
MVLDQYLSANLRERIEEQFYAKVNEQARLATLLRDPAFQAAPDRHVGLFSDHGVVHVRDVAQQILTVLERVHGVLIPRRSPERFRVMQGVGVLLAYFHDIGMADSSAFGRAMHPEFAAQALFRPENDALMEAIWQENSGGLADWLTTLCERGALPGPPQLRLRECLALTVCHSKSKAPIAVLNDQRQLRALLLTVIGVDLATLYAHQRQTITQDPLPFTVDLRRYYSAFPSDAFPWLLSCQPEVLAFVDDLIDTVRALRCADALRQRGTVLRTSGGYEIFMDQASARAVVALTMPENQLFFLAINDPISAGEANIAGSELDGACDLRIAFHRGHFTDPGATDYAVACAAHIVDDIQQDVIESFVRPVDNPMAADRNATAGKPASAIRILLEETDEQLDFVERVQTHLAQREPALAAKVQIAPSLQQAPAIERARYLAAPPLVWTPAECQTFLAQVATTGYRTETIDLAHAFDHVKLITLAAGETLVESGAPAAFVYIPLQPGLRIFPLGGYTALSAQPWMPLGVTGVIRGAGRNATIRAEAAVQLIVIPKMIYLKYWHHPYTLASFLAHMKNREKSLGSIWIARSRGG